MNRTVRFGFGFIFALLVARTAPAQRRSQSHWADSQPASLAIRGGLAQLYGDLKDPLATRFWGVSLIVPLTNTVAVEVPTEIGSLKAQQSDFYHSYANTRFVQAGLTASVDLVQWFDRGEKRVEIRPYAGAGLLFFRAEAFDLTTGVLQRLTNNQNSHRSRDGIEARGKAGIKMTHERVWLLGIRGGTALSRRMSIFGDIRLNLVRSDKLDATLDGNNQTMLPGTPVFTEGNHYRKNSSDTWGYAAVGLNFYFGERFQKP